jgi:hypothetical protein
MALTNVRYKCQVQMSGTNAKRLLAAIAGSQAAAASHCRQPLLGCIQNSLVPMSDAMSGTMSD